MLERSRRVVLLIDYDNLQICASRDTPGRELQLTPVVQLAQKYGTVILARAYAEWNLSTERLAVYKAGIEPAFAPVLRTESDRSGKSLADTVMVAEGMDMLWTLSPEVVVLATSDKDLIPLVRVAKQRGAFVVVLGSDFTAIPLREMADEHITYKQLITEAGAPGAARQPAALPEPTRRRATRERNGRESRQTAATSSTSTSAATPMPARTESQPTSPGAAAEPVAPVTAVAPGESDGQASGRRRRRRGSRRRSDRIGATGETGAEVGGEGSVTAEASDAAPEASAPPEAAAHAEPEVAAPTADAGTAAPSAEPETATEATPPAEAPRTRRRRTRAAAATEPEPEAAAQVPLPDSAAEPAAAPPVSEPTPETPAPETDAAAEEAPAPRTRARRVASASRGRSRVVR